MVVILVCWFLLGLIIAIIKQDFCPERTTTKAKYILMGPFWIVVHTLSACFIMLIMGIAALGNNRK